MRRRGTTGKAGDGEIETAPEEMHRTAFAAEAGAKFFQDAIGLEQDAPEAVGLCAIVGPMRLILFEGDGIFDLVRQMVDLHGSWSSSSASITSR